MSTLICLSSVMQDSGGISLDLYIYTPCHIWNRLMQGNEPFGVIDFLFLFSIDRFCFSNDLLFNNINLSIESKKENLYHVPSLNRKHAGLNYFRYSYQYPQHHTLHH